MSADLDNDLLILLLDVARHVRTYANRLAKAQGMTQAQGAILTWLEHQPDRSQNELAAIAELAPMTIARLVDRLEELGLVRRCTDPQGRRIWRLRLTPAAAPLSREITRFRAKLHSAATKGIEPLVLKTVDLGLRQMKENVSACRSAEANAYGGSQCPA